MQNDTTNMKKYDYLIVGSGLFGVWGMICAVPFFAVIYTIIRENCDKSLAKKGINYSSETYQDICYINEETKAPDSTVTDNAAVEGEKEEENKKQT